MSSSFCFRLSASVVSFLGLILISTRTFTLGDERNSKGADEWNDLRRGLTANLDESFSVSTSDLLEEEKALLAYTFVVFKFDNLASLDCLFFPRLFIIFTSDNAWDVLFRFRDPGGQDVLRF